MSVELDITTLAITLSLVTLSMTLLLCMAAWHADNQQGLRHWALGNSALMLGLLLNINQDYLHHGLSVILANGLMAGGLGIIWLGIRAFKGLSQPRAVPIASALLMMLLLWLLRFPIDSLVARVSVSSLGFALLCLLCSRELLIKVEPPLRGAYWFTGILTLLCCFGLMVRAIASLNDAMPAQPMADSPLQHLTLLAVMVAQIGIAGGFILMSHYRSTLNLRRLSERDALTGTLNRRSFSQQAQAQLEHASQTQQPITLIMLDADHFKRVNDQFGHQIGDAVLCHMVARIRQQLRSDDLLGRFGGEEFTLILPGLNTHSAGQVAERIRRSVGLQPQELADHEVPLSISLGVACSEHHGYAFETLLAAADAALYRAKAMGRNRVELARHPSTDQEDQMALRLLSQFRHNLDV
ncbi:GGDEF domain-containing protein [Pseudomonas jilinensis]|uniref:diguanylate cyclase n=1 Tax=Pseudomonas jilinensis TaxID=2078689 RepID=A0A396RXK3_9PSED|nr:GGDEF domain-containing protein [Pseudomonas jilinensis]RHW21358.1 hypothetical protein C2846_09580 [Pseudomonas jilinensis]